MSAPRGIAILGSTGSIGRSTLAVLALHPERFRVAVLGAHGSWEAIVEQARAFKPATVVLVDPQAAAKARAQARPAIPAPTIAALRIPFMRDDMDRMGGGGKLGDSKKARPRGLCPPGPPTKGLPLEPFH